VAGSELHCDRGELTHAWIRRIFAENTTIIASHERLRLNKYAYWLQLHYAIIAVTYRTAVGTYGGAGRGDRLREGEAQ
jgi:hypothetical protein